MRACPGAVDYTRASARAQVSNTRSRGIGLAGWALAWRYEHQFQFDGPKAGRVFPVRLGFSGVPGRRGRSCCQFAADCHQRRGAASSVCLGLPRPASFGRIGRIPILRPATMRKGPSGQAAGLSALPTGLAPTRPFRRSHVCPAVPAPWLALFSSNRPLRPGRCCVRCPGH